MLFVRRGNFSFPLNLILVFAVTQWLISCSTVPTVSPIAPPTDYATHQQQLSNINNWTLKGKIGFKSAQDTLSATITWKQQQDSYQIRLSGMLGTTLMEMNGHEGFAELHVDGKYYVDDNPEQLLKRITGWQLPVNQLSSLVKGQLPDNGFKVTETTNNWPETIVETKPFSPWKVRYNNYQSAEWHSGNHVWLPYDLRLTKAKNLIKIRVTTWEIHK